MGADGGDVQAGVQAGAAAVARQRGAAAAEGPCQGEGEREWGDGVHAGAADGGFVEDVIWKGKGGRGGGEGALMKRKEKRKGK